MTHLAHPTLPATALCLDTADNPPRRPGKPFRLVSAELGVSSCQRCDALQAARVLRREALAEARANLPAPTPLTREQRRNLRAALPVHRAAP